MSKTIVVGIIFIVFIFNFLMNSNLDDVLKNNIMVSAAVVIFVLSFILTVVMRPKIKTKKYSVPIKGLNKLDIENIKYCRDIPCNIYRAYYLLNIYDVSINEVNLLTAVILKWIKEDQITIIEENNKKVFDFSKMYKGGYEPEKALYNYLKSIDFANHLSKNKFEKLFIYNSGSLMYWTQSVMDYEKETLINNGKLKYVEGSNKESNHYEIIDTTLEEDAKRLIGLKKFLKEISNIDTKTTFEVKMWEDYLMYATFFDIADKTEEKIKLLNPINLSEKVGVFEIINILSLYNLKKNKHKKYKGE